jgi:hypothetical protein
MNGLGRIENKISGREEIKNLRSEDFVCGVTAMGGGVL